MIIPYMAGWQLLFAHVLNECQLRIIGMLVVFENKHWTVDKFPCIRNSFEVLSKIGLEEKLIHLRCVTNK